MYNIVRPQAPVDSHPGLPAPNTLGTNTSEAQATATITSSLGIILSIIGIIINFMCRYRRFEYCFENSEKILF